MELERTLQSFQHERDAHASILLDVKPTNAGADAPVFFGTGVYSSRLKINTP